MKTQIIDNALDSEDFEEIEEVLMSDQFPWFWNEVIAYEPSAMEKLIEGVSSRYNGVDIDKCYFTHQFYSQYVPVSEAFNLIRPLIKLLNPRSLIRVKANSYTGTRELVHHDNHVDFPFEHKGAIFYINTNNGLTVLEDGTECESVANRLLLFDASKPHHSTTCTDQKRRVNINMNYM
jgi:hypothetical protein